MTISAHINSFKDELNSLSNLKTSEINLLFNIFEKLSIIKDQDAIRKEIFDDLLCLFNADFIASFIWDQDEKVFRKGVSVNMSIDNLSQYECYYQFHDPITSELQKKKKATLVCEVMPQKDLVNTEFFNDFLHKDGLYYGMNVYAYDGNLNIGDLRIWRAKHKSNFGKREVALLNIILPYFRNALRNIRTMTMAKGESTFWNKLLENTQTALFLFDDKGTLIFRNKKAMQIEKTLTKAEYISFYSYIRSLACKNFYHTEWGIYYLSACSVSYPKKEQPMTAVMANQAAPIKIDKDLLSIRHHLTPREIEVCLLVCKGLIDTEIAEVLGITFYTVRTHLKNIFMKVDVTNRSELISVLFEGIVDISF
ncbi:MAG: helix-turn-helix transcriptional regulator [Proteobacteria bacterium]|nr:helix-turn-helix transcriptional regulator [Pseudomonadota bacterium]